MDTLTLWSRRWAVTRGWHWRAERACAEITAHTWLSVFQADEPGVRFTLAYRKPRAKG